MLIEPAELAERLNEVLIWDVRFYLTDRARGQLEYQAGHIPGAVFVDLEDRLSSPRPDRAGGRHPLPTQESWTQCLQQLGVQPGDTVVTYDQKSSLSAARAWWMLSDSNINTLVLNGGYQAWVESGLPITKDIPLIGPSQITVETGYFGQANAEDVQNRPAEVRLIDVRSPSRYRGENEPVDSIPGRIFGAENLPAELLQDSQGRYLPKDQLRDVLGELTASDILSCGSGITATQVALAAAVAGLAMPRVYIGSYSDWITDSNRPVAYG